MVIALVSTGRRSRGKGLRPSAESPFPLYRLSCRYQNTRRTLPERDYCLERLASRSRWRGVASTLHELCGEVPITVIEQEAPNGSAPRDESMCRCRGREIFAACNSQVPTNAFGQRDGSVMVTTYPSHQLVGAFLHAQDNSRTRQ